MLEGKNILEELLSIEKEHLLSVAYGGKRVPWLFDGWMRYLECFVVSILVNLQEKMGWVE
jgi:hypothetical protein